VSWGEIVVKLGCDDLVPFLELRRPRSLMGLGRFMPSDLERAGRKRSGGQSPAAEGYPGSFELETITS
jgi:hypothetical protein